MFSPCQEKSAKFILMSSLADVEKDFVAWFTGNGAELSAKVAFKDFSGEQAGRGLVALEDIKEDEVLFTVPRKLLLSHKTTSCKTDVARYASKEGWSRIMWSIVLERLKGEGSFWAAYFNIIPAQFNLPISWSKEDRAALSGTSVDEMIGEPEKDFKGGFAKVAKKMAAAKDISTDQLRDLYFYSGSLVSSYSFMEDDGTIVMVPMADMLNHRTGFNNARLFFEEDELKMLAVKDISAGEQLYNTYGDLGNAELLFKYGFVDDPNPFSNVEFGIGEFVEWAEENHKCSIHNPSTFKASEIDRCLDKGSIADTVELPADPTVCLDLLKWIHRGYKGAGKLEAAAGSYKNCVLDLLRFRLGKYGECAESESPNQKLAQKLIAEQKAIINSYIAFIEQQ